MEIKFNQNSTQIKFGGGISELTPAPSEAITHTQVPDCGTQRGDQWVDPGAQACS